MDPLACLLEGPRARGAFVLRSLLRAPWSMRIEDGAPLTVVAVVRGGAWIVTDAGERRQLGPADIAVLRGPGHYVVADDPTSAVQVVIGADQSCRAPDGQEVVLMGPMGVRSWGNDQAGETMLLTGTYLTRPELSAHLLAALPPLLVLPGADWSNPLVDYLTQESERDAPGQDAVLDRLLDLLLIAVLRAWFARPEAAAPGWYRAHGHPVIGSALALMHDRPGEPWTVASLARETGTSRAALARRFHELVGEPPMAYLTHWRLSLAADLLAASDLTLEAVARQVGYSTAFALSAAFKRVRGISPSQYRRSA